MYTCEIANLLLKVSWVASQIALYRGDIALNRGAVYTCDFEVAISGRQKLHRVACVNGPLTGLNREAIITKVGKSDADKTF